MSIMDGEGSYWQAGRGRPSTGVDVRINRRQGCSSLLGCRETSLGTAYASLHGGHLGMKKQLDFLEAAGLVERSSRDEYVQITRHSTMPR